MRSDHKAELKASFPTEEALCAAFIRDIQTQPGWIVYPETAGFDILLVREDTGHQLGIEAKLTLNDKVITQILPGDSQYGGYWEQGPDWRAVLVPEASPGIATLLRIVGVMVFVPSRDYRRAYRDLSWRFDISNPRSYETEWHDWNPKKRCGLPEIVPRVAAGVPSPLQLTPWKIGALKVLAIIQLDGSITREEVRSCGVDPRRFCAADGWLVSLGNGRWGGPGNMPPFEKQHPEAFAEVLGKLRDKRAGVKG